MVKNKRDWLILILIIAVVVLLSVLAYLFLIKPALSGLVIQGQNQAIVAIFQQAATCNAIPLTLGNQTLNLVAYECLQQQTQ